MVLIRTEDEERIEKEIAEGLEKHPELGNYGITVYFHQGKVVLNGVVDVIKDKIEAEKTVRMHPAVKWVENGLTLGNEKLYDDKKLKKDVEEELMRSKRIDLRKIGVEVDNGNISLVGECDSKEEEQMAMEIISRVQGVKDVYSQLEHRR
jgi:osmotically-inducible protein OsmY